MFTALANMGLIAQSAATRALAVRQDLAAAQDFYNWISAQADGDLTGIGFAPADLGFMRSMAADLSAFAAIYHGQPPPETYVLPYNFAASSTQVIGAG